MHDFREFEWFEYGVTVSFYPFDWHWRIDVEPRAWFGVHFGPFYLRVGI